MTSVPFDIIACLIAAASLGAMVFFSAVVAPTVFQAMPSEHAGKFLRALFPRYFLLNGMAALAAAALARQTIPAALFALGGLAMIGVRLLLIPKINEARDAVLAGDSQSKAKFDRLHRASVLVNLAEMCALAVAVFLIGRS